ncbi:hypothetical protein GH714_042299 [Hevea brasiliensis]|uniref:Hydroxyproline O-arabinosyltransferase-like domain-containing protein n=1 Tax=Hevea brasiliensis TaxID=3981 RepID=A0A6A6KTI2_HEVBR|nr:hypothetical protein GH714_042299 [Hevea brasiliensis]
MTGRKNMGRVSPFFLVLLSLGFSFAMYNLLTFLIQYKSSNSGDGLELSDPITNMPQEVKRLGKSNSRYHVALTATDAPYSQWQCRIMYYWYKKMKDMPGSDMGKFTRVLHSGKPDNLMEEIPTFIVDPLPQGLDRSILEEISPTWVNISLRMKDDPETDKAFGWVLEMYAYAVASALHGVQHILRKDFMIQPPWDLEVGKRFIIHYTYGCDYNLKGELTYGKIGEWRFDKRSYLSGSPPKNLSLPPPGVPESVRSTFSNGT